MQKGIKKIATGVASAVAAFGMGAMPVMAQGINIAPPDVQIGADIGRLITQIINIAFAIGVLLTLAYLIWGAFNWITSGGDKSKTGEARSKIIAAVVGLILLAAAWGLLNLVLQIIGAGDIQGIFNNLTLD